MNITTTEIQKRAPIVLLLCGVTVVGEAAI
jgi:hypothetical protein